MLATRRSFLQAAVAPLFIPSSVFGANDRINIGVIGVGNRSNLLIDQLPETGRIITVADVFVKRCEDAATKRKAKWLIHGDYRRILDNKDVDAVIIGTTDHTRAIPCIHACQAGKDVYAEKPLTLYIAEGRAIVKAARKYKRVFQVGSQQRSMEMNRIACEFVRNGGLGKITMVQGVSYTSSARYTTLPEEPIPATLNWDVWQGQAPVHPYNKKLHTGWMAWRDYSGGEMTNWGAHGIDQLQWALGMSETGPVEIWPLGTDGSIAWKYANGQVVQLDQAPNSGLHAGGRITGEKGSIDILRNTFKTNPDGMIKNLPDAEDIAKWNDDRAKWQARYHMQNWLDCVKSRQKPVADVEIGHRTITISHLANITRELNRKLEWDPKRERFPHDAEAQKMVNRERRKGYELPKV